MQKSCQLQNKYGNNIEINHSVNESDTLIYILIPGFMGSMTNPPIQVLFEHISQQTAVITFNFIGKHESDFPTITECMNDLETVVKFFYRKDTIQFILIGHSLGGKLAVKLATSTTWRSTIKSLVLLAMPYTLKKFEERHTMLYKEDSLFEFVQMKEKYIRVKKEFIQEYDSINIHDLLQTITIKTIVIQGDKDKRVSQEESLLILAALHSEKVFYKVKDAGHTFSNTRTQVEIAKTILNLTKE